LHVSGVFRWVLTTEGNRNAEVKFRIAEVKFRIAEVKF